MLVISVHWIHLRWDLHTVKNHKAEDEEELLCLLERWIISLSELGFSVVFVGRLFRETMFPVVYNIIDHSALHPYLREDRARPCS